MKLLMSQLQKELGLGDRADLNSVKIGDCFVTYKNKRKHKLDFDCPKVLEVDLKLFCLDLVENSSSYKTTLTLTLGKQAYHSSIEYLKAHTEVTYGTLGQSFAKSVIFHDPTLDIEAYYYANFAWIVVTKVVQSKVTREFFLAKI